MGSDRVKHLKSVISEARKELKMIQDECEHTRAIYKYGSSTGDVFSPDTYWLDIECLDCDCRKTYWQEEDEEAYRLKGVVGSVLKVPREQLDTVNGVENLEQLFK